MRVNAGKVLGATDNLYVTLERSDRDRLVEGVLVADETVRVRKNVRICLNMEEFLDDPLYDARPSAPLPPFSTLPPGSKISLDKRQLVSLLSGKFVRQDLAAVVLQDIGWQEILSAVEEAASELEAFGSPEKTHPSSLRSEPVEIKELMESLKDIEGCIMDAGVKWQRAQSALMKLASGNPQETPPDCASEDIEDDPAGRDQR